MNIDFSLSFDIAMSEIVSVANKKGKITIGSDNYWVLMALFNQKYLDDYDNKAMRPNGSKVHNTVKRVSDLRKKYKIPISDEWNDGHGRGDYKRFWMSRRQENEA